MQPAQGVGFHLAVDVEEGLELAHQAVLLALHHFGVFVDGEVEGGDELSVLPWLADVKLIVELAIARHEVNDNGHGGHENENFV